MCDAIRWFKCKLKPLKKQRNKCQDMVDASKVLNTKYNCESFLPQVGNVLDLKFYEIRSKPHAN